MKTYQELSKIHRTEPCLEYPGEWLVYCGKLEKSFASKEEAVSFARKRSNDGTKVMICWRCSEDDPRQGKEWFTMFRKYCEFS